MKEKLNLILEEKNILPFWTITDIPEALEIAGVLVRAEVPVVEIAFRSEYALPGIRELKKVDGLLVGAGTVKTPEEARKALEAGADFIVSPGYLDEIVDICLEAGVPVYPGVVTPGEILKGYQKGIRDFKFFPAEAYGGTVTLKALKGPFPDIRFLPTGGVEKENYRDYTALSNVLAVGGSFIIPKDLVKEKDWAGLERHIRGLV
ncbi:MAG TPA: bifunctional 4-hydroxy-2-oxoglutarate aldolase/2-dehydro-3-deoxy-phosphogluconate aldolase [Candidatus Bariatricus faecipullorum]|nr:bifunctional 4-hydroxy-2-oxoglutarate aldolase/2-dehydro-3-deoxy-phosphogluconate aldolase [Candidatus Bariatricus faecipullorum]